MFEENGNEDKYLASLYQHLFKIHIDEVLKENNAEDNIAYEDGTISSRDTSQIELKTESLENIHSSVNISLNYILREGEEIDNELIINMVNGIHKDIDESIFVFSYVYTLSSNDQKIAIMLNEEAQLFEIYTIRNNGMDTWGANIFKVRNNADFFKFLDCFSTKADYLYSNPGPFGEHMNKHNLENNKKKNIFE